jgi:hypothetical protein
MHNVSRCAEIDKRFPGLMAAIINAHKIQSEGNRQASGAAGRKPAKAKRKM